MTNRPQRLEILDLARGIGFLVVLLQHCLGFLGAEVPARFVPQDATILDFFFLMSGFFAGYAYEEKLRDGRKTMAQAVVERAIRIFPLVALGSLLGTILLFYTFALLLYVLLSWVAPGTYSPASALVSSLCEPLLAPVRRVIPPLGGIDFSAAFVIIALWALYIAINEYLLTPGY